MKEEMEETLPARPVATQLRPLNTTQPGPVDDESPAFLTWTSSLDFSCGNDAAVRAFVELVSRVSAVEPGETLCIRDTAGGGHIEAPVDGNGMATGTWKFVNDQQDAAGGVPTDFSIGPGKTLQLHVKSNGKAQLVARASIVPQPALQALGEALQDILMHQHGTGKQQESEENKEGGKSTTTTTNAWTSASVLNWPPQQKPAELWSGDNNSNGDLSDGQPALLHSWFEQRARDSGDLVALDFLSNLATGERTQFTYRQVSNASNALAVQLSRLASTSPAPAGAVRTVAVAMGPCPELYLSYLAALKAGLAFCPIPVDAPRERQEALLADLQPVAVLVLSAHEQTLGHVTQPIIDVSPFLAECDTVVPSQPRARPISDTDPAYILYTSGTTGLPKGVIVSHRSASCTVSALNQHYGFSTSSAQRLRWFQGAAPTFDISIFEIFWTLSTGSTLCCAPRHLTMQDIDGVLSALQADITNVTPSFASLISPSVLQGLMVGGETLNARLLQDFAANAEIQDDGRPRGIYNGYGPTEVAMYSLAQPHVPANQRGSIIGTPLATCGVLIVETQPGGLHPVPQGAVGELVLLGPQVSITGYLNSPEETAKAFVNDEHWGRAYRTGDRARIVWNDNGKPVVEFLGRLSDAQVKLSGRRVELGEIENVLASKTRGVQQTLACVWKPEAALGLGSERVVSLVVVDPKSGLDFAAVSANCAEAARKFLPDYMRPFRVLQVNELPRSASGKANRKAAAEYVHKILQAQIGKDAQTESQPAQVLDNAEDARIESELVRILSSIVSETDSIPQLTATTNLASAGVDSLRAMRLLREIRKQQIGSENLPLQPSLAMLLDPGATIRSVFFSGAATSATENHAAARKRVDDFASRHSAASLERLSGELSQVDVEMVLPMTSTASQLAVSFAMDSSNYVSNSVLPLKADVSLDALESAVRAVFSRLAVYRSAIVPCSDDMSPFAQVILTPSAWKTWTADRPRIVRRRGSTSTEDRQTWLAAAQQNLDFDSNQLYHVQLVESDADGTGLLIISIAHCLCDGASVELLLADIAREYAGREPLSRLSVRDSVLDWAANVNPETDRHWQDSLKEWEADSFHALSGDNVKSGGDHNSGHALATFSSSLSWFALEEKSRALGASPLSILQAAWSLLLKVWSEANTEDIVFGSVLSAQHEACHAPTFSVVPCRVPLPDQQTVDFLLSTLVESGRFTQGHRHTSFGLFGSLPYNTALALQAYGTEVEANVPWTAVELPAIRYDFDVFAEVMPQADENGLLFKVTYRADALSETSAQVVARQFAALAEKVLDASPRDLSQGLLSHLPRDLLSVEGTIPVPSVDQEQQQQERVDVLHAQFESQAAATPDKLALSFYASLDAPPTNLTYAELDARANGLAHILRREDADVIPICMHRSVDLYVSILAILKAGSAWSPIDETSPVQRRTSLIARTQGKVLLTTTDSYPLVEPCLAHESLAGVRVIFVDRYADQSTTERPKPRNGVTSPSTSAITGQDLAYLLWTSGTTGEPKGVMIQHFAAANAMRDLQVRVEHDPAAGQVRTLQLSAYSFDVFVQDLFFTWGLAGSVISGTRELVLGTFTDFVKTSRPTHAHLTPSFGASIDVSELAGSTLRFVTFIGEKLTEDVAEAWAQPEITTKAYNTYGPAENAVVSTMRQFFGKSRDRAKAANVGFPLTPCTAYVVREVLVSADNDNTDENAAKRWELVPRYGVGELALGGAQVGKGYLNNVAKTTKAFIQGDPASIGERIYLTGDMVRLNDHGFEFLGRNDDLVKITGIRIELSEISAACALVKEDEPIIEHVETLYLPRPGGDANHKVIVTFVSVKGVSPDDVDTAAIRQRVFQKARDVLPAYMVPGHVVVLDTTMPRTASNKVDRKALQAIYSSADLNVLAGQSGGNGAQDAAAKVRWREEQLPVVQAVVDNLASSPDAANPLSPEDSLAGRGFSSLQITKLAWALRKQLGCSVRVLDLMHCQTVGELVDVVVTALNTEKAEAESREKDKTASKPTTSTAASPAPTSWVSYLKDNLTQSLVGAARPSNTDYILPATPVQEALLVETMVEPGAYWSHRLFDLAGFGVVDTQRLRAAWEAAAARLDILRTVFVPLSQLCPKTIRGVSVSTAEWARAHGVHAAVLQLVLQDASVQWTELDGDNATADGLAVHAQKIQSALLPLGGDSRQPPWALTYAPASKTLMLSMHHALYDGDSSQMLLDVVARLYNDASSTTALPLLPMSRGLELGLLPSASQRDDATAAWSKHIHDLVETDGAVNSPFPDLTGSRQAQSHAILSAKATIPADFLAHAVDRPDLPRLVQSAFGCVLAAVLELKTIVLGQTVSQRILHPDLAHVVGPAVATLPVAIRTQASNARALWSEMGRDASLLGAHAHHLHPVDIKKMSNEGSGNPHAPFPALFVYHPAVDNANNDTFNPASAFHEFGQALSLHVEHAMALNIFEGDRTMELTGDARRISQPMLDLMLAQILDQARAMLSHPDVPLSQLSNLMDRSLVSVVGEPQTLVGTKIAANPAELVTKQAADHPDWLAIEEVTLDDDDQISTTALTYRELEVLVNSITAQIVALAAAKPGDVVAVYLDRNAASLAAIISVFKLNFVYLPIDGDLPAARKQLLVRDANARLVISTQSLVGDLELTREAGGPVPFLLPEGSDDLDIIRSWSPSSVPVDVGSADPSAGGYLLYTSGSTGRPKGVRVANKSLLHYIAAMTQRLAEANPDVANLGGVGKFLNVASRAFDTHLTTMFSPWYLGFCSVIGKDRNGIFANLQHVINTVGITNMGTVPSVLLQLGLRLSDVPSIRVMTFGGEKASHELFDQLGGSDGGGDSSKAALMNFYGPTEAAVGCLSHTVGHHSNARNLGLPLPGLEALLLVSGSEDGQQVLARRGQPGEFCIAGPQVAVGYLDRPDENARSFQSTTLLCADGTEKRMYRTGDIMRMMHDGTVEFLGRRDQQTKIRGQRFEIGEVEAYIKKVIADQGALDVAAAVVDQRLVGLLARKQAALLKAEREAPAELLSPPPGQVCRDLLAMVEQACQKDLPAFMVPEMMWLSKMPFLAVSGKFDVKQISQLVRDADNSAGLDNQPTASTVAALTPPEKQVLAALEEVLVGLKSSAVSSQSNIRGLGIDSLSGVHLLSVLKQRGFVNVSLTDLLSPSASVNSLSQKFAASGTVPSRPRVARVAPVEESRQTRELSLSDLGPSAGHVDAANVSAVLPCLPLQSSLVALTLNWLHNEEEADVVPYVTQFNYQLASGVDVATWKLAAEQVVSSEAVLRTCFIQRDEDGQIFQVVLTSPPSPFATLSSDSNVINAVSLVSKMNSRPPIRLSVQEDGRVSLLIHHALYDGAAIASLRAKIEQTYLALTSGTPTPSTFSDSLATLRRLANHCNLSGAQMQSVKSSWQDKLKNVSPCRVDRSSSQSKQHPSSPSPHVTARSTRRLAYTATELKSRLQLSVSLPAAFQLATVLVLANLTAGSPSIVYGYTTSLRSLLPHVADNMDGFIGPCLNTVVHALPLQDAGETLHHLASRVDQNHAEVSEGIMPLVTADQIQRWSGLDGKLFDSLLTINFVDEPSSEADVPSIMQPLPGNAKLDLALTIDIDQHQDGRIELLLASAGVLSESQLESAAGLFEKLVENAASSDATVGQFVSLSKSFGSAANGTANGSNTNSTRSASSSSRSSHTSVSTSSSDSELASVRSIVCQLLRLDESAVPADSSLYRLGLDSINVLPFVKLVNKAESIKITPNAVIRARTLHGVAALVHAAKSKGQTKRAQTLQATASSKAIVARGPSSPSYDKILQQVAGDLLFVATPLQEGMLSASMSLADQAYTYTHTMQLSSAALQQDAPGFSLFFAAVQDTVLACEILRTRFIFTDNNHAPWVGVVSPTDQSDLVNWKVSASGVIQLRIHHALYDASSIQALWRLLRKNYTARLSATSTNAQGAHLYRHFAKQVAVAQDSAVSFWMNTVQDFNYTPAAALVDGGSQKHASSSFHFALDAEDLATLQTTCRNANVALKAAMQLAWAKVLCEALYLQADIVFGEVITTSSDDADDTVVMGPTINTIPMRLQLSGPNSLVSIADALSKLQGLGDQARGPSGMASLRDVQTAWRSSRADGIDTSAGLFQSLFVFDGDVSTPTTTRSDVQNPIVPVSDSAEANPSTGVKAPLYDDYPLIASFRIRDGVLHGALRAKLSETAVHSLGSQLQSSLLQISSGSLQETALDPSAVSRFPTVAAPTAFAMPRETELNTNGTTSDVQLADTILDLAKQVVGSRIRGNVSYATKLVNIGLDSISAIRFSNLLKKMGIHVSVFDIIKGASVESIVQKLASSKQAQPAEEPQAVQNMHSLVKDSTLAKTLAAAKLGLPSSDRIKSVLPVLSGQRHTLQHWLHSGKRFFEAPWVYRIAEGRSIDAQTAAGFWAKLCQTHDILQTTFVSLDHSNVPDLVQVTLHADDSTTAHFIDVQDKTITIQHLIETYVRDTNSTRSDLTTPPTRLSFLDAADGQAIVIRVHHALYDAWSIKMILSDLASFFSGIPSLESRPSLETGLGEIVRFRTPMAEQNYWKQHLASGQDTILQPNGLPSNSASAPTAPLGPHFKASYPGVLSVDEAADNKTQTSAAIIAAYAQALGQQTNTAHPTFGLNYSSRSLTSANGEQTLELTGMSLPTMTVVPMTVNLQGQKQPLDAVHEHLVELTKFAQADDLHKLSARYNTHINILFSDADRVQESGAVVEKNEVLQRHRLGEPLASEYFTKTVPLPNATSTVDGINISSLPKEQLYFNVLVRNGSVNVDVSGDEDLLGGDANLVANLVASFSSYLSRLLN